MLRFGDFDAWGDAVRGAHLTLVCDRVETNVWRLGVANLGDVVVQAAFEGGGNLCYGANTHRGPTLFLPLTLAEQHVVNGQRLDDRSILFIPPGADFRIQVRRLAHAWCSIALPPDEDATHAVARWGSRVVRADAEAVQRLKGLAGSVASSPVFASKPGAAHAAAAVRLRQAAAACLAPAGPAPAAVGRPRIDRAEIIRRALEMLRVEPVQRRSVAVLAESVGVTDRTLARAFHESFGVSPRTYVTLRLLHDVRRALRHGHSQGHSVTDVLVRHGIWEFGRFAARYRHHCGESPSDTLRRGDG